MHFIDAHVHIYDCYDLDSVFDSAYSNFRAAATAHGRIDGAARFSLLLAEGAGQNWFHQQLTGIIESNGSLSLGRRWQAIPTGDSLSFRVQRKGSPDEYLDIIAGRQIVTAERLEVLALACGATLADGLPLRKTLAMIREHDALPVIPWGAGKWLGERGRLLKALLLESGKGTLFLGDNGGRPQMWRSPKHFQYAEERGVMILPGSDPLPLSHEAARVASFGFSIARDGVDAGSPAREVKNLLQGNCVPLHFGSLLANARFIANQLQLRLTRIRD